MVTENNTPSGNQEPQTEPTDQNIVTDNGEETIIEGNNEEAIVEVNIAETQDMSRVVVNPGETYIVTGDITGFAQDGTDLLLQAGEKSVLFEGFFVFLDTETPPVLNVNGNILESETIISQIENFNAAIIAPAAGTPAADTPDPTGGGGGAGFNLYSIGSIGEGINPLDLLGNLDFGFANEIVIEEVGDLEPDEDGDGVFNGVPIAIDDTNSVTEGEIITGSLIENDIPGPDTPASILNVEGSTRTPDGWTAQGQYGFLTVFNDGTYEYEANTNLNNPEVIQDSFVYTLVDNNGDTDDATLTIDITDGPGPSVEEEGPSGTPVTLTLDDDNTIGSSDTDTNLIQFRAGSDNIVSIGFVTPTAGSVTVNGLDGSLTWVMDGNDLIGHLGDTSNPEIRLTLGGDDTANAGDVANVTITATLSEALKHQLDTDNISIEGIKVIATDLDNNASDGDGTATADVVVNVDDSLVDANDDANSVTEGETVVVSELTGVIKTNDDEGADTPTTVTNVVRADGNADGVLLPSGNGWTVQGMYGVLTLNTDGSYTYTANDNINNPNGVQDVFTYTLTDDDGDFDTATLTIDIVDGIGPSVNDPETGPVNLVLDDADTIGSVDTDQESIEFQAGSDDIVSIGFVTPTAGSVTVNGLDGNLTWVMDGNDLIGHSGDTSNPEIRLTLNGVSTIPAGDTGSVDITATLSTELKHQLNTDVIVIEGIDIIATDSDGNASDGNGSVIADVVVTVNDDLVEANNDTNSVTEGETLTVNTINGVISNDVVGADTPGTVTGVNGGTLNNNAWTVQGQYGILTLMVDGSYTYTANNNINNPNGVQDVFTYTLTDDDGDSDTATLTIDIVDGIGPSVQDPATGPVNLTLDDADTIDGDDIDTNSIVFEAGSDDIVSIGFVNPNPGDITVTGIGETLTWTVVGNQLIGYTSGNSATPEITLSLGGDATIPAENTGTVNVIATLSEALKHQLGSDSINIQGIGVIASDSDNSASDGNGSVTADIEVTVSDTVVVAINDTNSVTEGETVTVNEINGVIKSNDTEGADIPALITDVERTDGNASGVPLQGGGWTVQGIYGVLTLNTDGSYTYVADNNINNPDGVQDVFTYTLTDDDGDSDTATLTIDIVDGIGPSVQDPASGPVNLTLDDADTIGGVDTDQESIVFEAGSDDIVSIEFVNPAPGDIVVTGSDNSFTWNKVGDTLVGFTAGNSATPEIVLSLGGASTITAGNTGTVNVTATLSDALKHELGSNTINIEGIEVRATDTDQNASDGDGSVTADVTVTVADDGTVANPDQLCVLEGQEEQATMNLLFVLDDSGSMGGSKIQALKDAVEAVAQAYEDAGVDFNISLVEFSSTGDAARVGSGVISDIPTLQTALNNLNDDGFTNYEDGLTVAKDVWNVDSAITGADSSNSVAYFISDGEPNRGTVDRADWESYVNNNFIQSIAVAVETPIIDDDLAPIAHTPSGPNNDSDDVILDADSNNLSDVLVSTITIPTVSSGNLLFTSTNPGDQVDDFGADGDGDGMANDSSTKIVDIWFDDGDGVKNGVETTAVKTGVVYTVTLPNGQGTVTINAITGDYTVTAMDVATSQTYYIGYTIEDSDGSTSSSMLTVCINDTPPPPNDVYTAVDDCAKVGNSGIWTGNVVNNDDPGDDGFGNPTSRDNGFGMVSTVSVVVGMDLNGDEILETYDVIKGQTTTFEGVFGTFTFDGDGNYTYEPGKQFSLKNGNDVQALEDRGISIYGTVLDTDGSVDGVEHSRQTGTHMDNVTVQRNGLGVDGNPNPNAGSVDVPNQINYNFDENGDEHVTDALVVDLGANKASYIEFDVSNLFKADKGNQDTVEYGKVSIYDGNTLLKEGIFAVDSGNKGTFRIDAPTEDDTGCVIESTGFDQVIFTALPYGEYQSTLPSTGEEMANVTDSDSSDYFVSGFALGPPPNGSETVYYTASDNDGDTDTGKLTLQISDEFEDVYETTETYSDAATGPEEAIVLNEITQFDDVTLESITCCPADQQTTQQQATQQQVNVQYEQPVVPDMPQAEPINDMA